MRLMGDNRAKRRVKKLKEEVEGQRKLLDKISIDDVVKGIRTDRDSR